MKIGGLRLAYKFLSMTQISAKADYSAELIEWWEGVQQALVNSLEAKKMVRTGALRDSIDASFQNEGDANKLVLEFLYYGKILDIRARYGSKAPPFQVVLQWVREVGASKFKQVPGYPKGVRPVGASHSKYAQGATIQEVKIAWAIVKGRVAPKNNNKRYGKKWWNRTFYAKLPELTQLLVDKTANVAVEELMKYLQ